MTFCTGPLSRPIACIEVLRFMIRGLGCVVVCGVPVPVDYIPTIVACADMSNDFIYGMFQCEIASFGFFDFGHIQFAMCGSWASLVVFLPLFMCMTIIDEDRLLRVRCSCCTVSRDGVVDSVFVNGE